MAPYCDNPGNSIIYAKSHRGVIFTVRCALSRVLEEIPWLQCLDQGLRSFYIQQMMLAGSTPIRRKSHRVAG